MADITNPQAVAFCNLDIRPLADAQAKLYFQCKRVVAAWNSRTMSDLIPNTVDVIVDGSASDGRRVCTAAEMTAIITLANEFIANCEASTQARLNNVVKVAVNF